MKPLIALICSRLCFALFISCLGFEMTAQVTPEILRSKDVIKSVYLPDFSYAGYKNGEEQIPTATGTVIQATDYGVVADDELDDSKALIAALDAVKSMDGKITLELPAGRIILSDIIYIERSNFVLKGAGQNLNGTELYFPRPLIYVPDPEPLQELREYLVEFDKVQREKKNNIELPYSQYAWSGGFIWTQVPGERVKSYLQKYEREQNVLAHVITGKRGSLEFKVKNASTLKVGDVVELQLFNKEGQDGKIIDALYHGADVKIGSHHWNFPDLPIVRQQVEIKEISRNTIKINTPLTIEIDPSYQARLIEWKHLENVGLEGFRINFPMAPRVAHHVEQGFNGIFLTRLFNSWVKDVVIHNADSGILSEEIANVTIKNITTTGDHLAHYTVAMAAVHNVLAEKVKVYNKAVHPLSFNTFSTKNVYKDCEIFTDPALDQHSGANHQNLFDNTLLRIDAANIKEYPLFAGGGAGYWKPSHGAYSTFWNLQVQLENHDTDSEFVLNGMDDGPEARIIGLSGNARFKIEYGPDAYMESINEKVAPLSLYEFQLSRRLR
ncbi:DUF4955 domain-containing protein [Nonlabens agnitus]|uniref:Uncharacterized protein n=1 Tax=Nonlabens agnitus TaxID=870484 RepID=A0A2S9WXW7_9FLAO|nr:DUF4955 domain-containing protein [Nonlabens agnitus]PRP68305.1 hypothetical protein BST86_06065 [Nonlabens agnitus]